jgi:CheY-like chemotaxis protein
VLLIGDPTGLRMAAVTMLRRDGHMVETVANAEEAIPLLDNEPYDVVFMDTEAAGKSVELTLRAMRDTGGPARGVPIVLLAPPHEDMDARIWRDAGADDILPHDPTLDDLVGAIGRDVWHSRAPLTDVGFMPGLEEDTEEGVPILAADRIAELQANIPPEDLLDMVEECISDLFHRLPALRRSLAASAPGAISAQAHAMVGMAGGYGMAVLEARLRAVLTAVRARRMDTIDGAATVIEADLTRAAAALRRTLRYGSVAKSGART